MLMTALLLQPSSSLASCHCRGNDVVFFSTMNFSEKFKIFQSTCRFNSEPSAGDAIQKAVFWHNIPFISIICEINIVDIAVYRCIIENWMKFKFTTIAVTVRISCINGEPKIVRSLKMGITLKIGFYEIILITFVLIKKWKL